MPPILWFVCRGTLFLQIDWFLYYSPVGHYPPTLHSMAIIIYVFGGYYDPLLRSQLYDIDFFFPSQRAFACLQLK